jgi:alpha-amylase
MSRLSRGFRQASLVLSLLIHLAGASVSLAQQDNNLVYHIFIRSFADTPSDTAPPGERGEAGDLKGIREQLDYLNDGDPNTDDDLEVGILWLMPIFRSRSYHGYDVTDYKDVNPEYGTIQDLKDLIDAAHQRGVRIILDVPFNHTSHEHPWFTQAVEDPSSRFRTFYHFSDADQPAPPGPWHIATSSTGQRVRYLGLFSPSMPDLNFDAPAVRQEVKAIAQFWLDQGIDGFRLDATKHVYGDTFGGLPEPAILRNNDWWREFSDHVARINPNAVLVGEVLGDRETLRRHAYGHDALLDEPFMHAARSRIAFPSAGFVTAWKEFVNRCRDVNRLAHQGPGSLPRNEPFHPFLFLASHDANPRLASHLEDMKRQGMQPSVDEAYRVGMYVLTSMGKYPILYNGDEVMQRGFKWNGNPPNGNPPGDSSGVFDETLREPFPWHKSGDRPPQTAWFPPRFDAPNDGVSIEEQGSAGHILHLVRALTNLRAEHPGYANGELGAILTDSADWMVFEKVSDQERYLVLINPTGHGHDYDFHQGWFPQYVGAQLMFWSDGQRQEWKDETSAPKPIETKVFVPPYGMVLLREKQG